MAKVSFKGFYSRDCRLYMGVEEAGIVYGFPAANGGEEYSTPDELVSILQSIMDNGIASLEAAGFSPQTPQEQARNKWEDI